MKKLLASLILSVAVALSGCGDSNQNFVITNNNVVSAPVVNADTYAGVQNQQLVVNQVNGVLANDAPNGGIATFPNASANGGTVAGNANGSFTYTPALNFSGADTFQYTVTNALGQANGTVTINVATVNGFFVDSALGSDATGNFATGAPFATVQGALGAAGANATIVVRPGTGAAYAGAVNLQNGQQLIGAGFAGVLPQGMVRPLFEGPIVMADGNIVRGIRIANSVGNSIDGDGQDGGIVSNCEIANSGGVAVQVRPGTGDWRIVGNTITGTTGLGVALQTTGTGTMTARVNSNTITGSGANAIGFTTENTSQCTAQVHNNTMTGNQAGTTFEVLSTETSVFCLDLEGNTNDDTYRFGIDSAGAVVNIEQLMTGPFSVPGNTGTFTVVGGAGFVDPTARNEGFCGF